jgi:hypothetical protein
MYDFCGMESFSDARITKCADCYALTEEEKMMSNCTWSLCTYIYLRAGLTAMSLAVIETVRQGCHTRVQPGSEFFLFDPSRIFSTTRIPISTVAVTPSGTAAAAAGGGPPDNLVLIIVLPIVGFLMLLLCLCVGCFFLVRHRRRRAKRETHSEYLHDRWNDTSIITPMPGGLRKLWNGEEAIDQHQMAASPHGQYVPGFYQSDSYQGASPVDVKYPPDAYLPGPSSATPGTEQQYQPKPWEYQHQQQDQKQEEWQQPQQQPATMPPPPAIVPILADPPPPRKSLSKKHENGS